jgi:hypothetical protein
MRSTFSSDAPATPGLGVPCAEAQADGVPCTEIRSDCTICGRAAPCPHMPDAQPAVVPVTAATMPTAGA